MRSLDDEWRDNEAELGELAYFGDAVTPETEANEDLDEVGAMRDPYLSNYEDPYTGDRKTA